jgi:hypothetical protein
MPRMNLGLGVKVTTDWVPCSRGTYVWTGNGGTWNGATAQLQTKSIDGSTAVNVPGAALNADGQWTVDIGDDAEVRIAISGGPPTGAGLSFSLARIL